MLQGFNEKVQNLRRVKPVECKKVYGSYIDVMMAKEEKPAETDIESVGVEGSKGGIKFMFNEYEGRMAPNTAKRMDYLPCSDVQTRTVRDGYH